MLIYICKTGAHGQGTLKRDSTIFAPSLKFSLKLSFVASVAIAIVYPFSALTRVLQPVPAPSHHDIVNPISFHSPLSLHLLLFGHLFCFWAILPGLPYSLCPVSDPIS